MLSSNHKLSVLGKRIAIQQIAFSRGYRDSFSTFGLVWKTCLL